MIKGCHHELSMIELLSIFASMPGGLGDALATSVIEHDVAVMVY